MKIFVALDWYLPGYRSGGPVRSIANLVERIGQDFEFFILTRNRDFQDSATYANLPLFRWLKVGNAKVYYAESLGFSTIRKRITETKPDVLYLNSLFAGSTLKVLLLRNLGLLPTIPVLIAPRGQLSPGALSIKGTKKSIFLMIALRAGLYNGLSWHATSEPERQAVRSKMRSPREVYLVPNLPSAHPYSERRLTKSPGRAAFIFVSRVSPKKNLHFALEAFLRLRGSQLSFDIYGPLDDAHYWEDVCLPLVRSASERLCITYHGAIPNSEVAALLGRMHFFVLPTLDENFGHAIVEAMMAGCPPVISDRTPWRGLAARGVGWDVPLDSVDQWTTVMQQCVDMDQPSYMAMSNASRQFALSSLHVGQIECDTAEMLRGVGRPTG